MLTDIMMQAAEEFEKQMSPKSVSRQLEEAEREAMAQEAQNEKKKMNQEPAATSNQEKPPSDEVTIKAATEPEEVEGFQKEKEEELGKKDFLSVGDKEEDEAEDGKSDIASVDEAAIQEAPLPPEGEGAEAATAEDASLFDFKTKTEFDVAMEVREC